MRLSKKIFFLFPVLFIMVFCCAEKKIFRIACFGDSITESKWGNYPGHLRKMFLKEGYAVNVRSFGRPGHTSGEYLNYLKTLFLNKKIGYDSAIIMLGTNDVRIDGDHTSTPDFISNMKKIIGLIKKRGEKGMVFLATIPPIYISDLYTFDKTSSERVEKEIVPAIKKIALEEGLELIDIHNFFNKKKHLLPGIHPSPAGYFVMAKYIYKRLNILPKIKYYKKVNLK